ncbi:phosphate acetyltransferase [Breoghania sp.]|uniref:phosphate acetyltransferase n=1 Tax=Breoghania sp. TaxID=2065378 RepID=UPI002AA7D7CF|nr:phosphate acetyltransferase [Breoghania sp.]
MSEFPKGRALFVMPTSIGDPTPAIAQAMVYLFNDAGNTVGYVKPVRESDEVSETDVVSAIPRRHAERLIREDRTADLLDLVVATVIETRGERNIMVVEGVPLLPGRSLISEMNQAMAAGLSGDIMPFVCGASDKPEDVIDRIDDVLHGIKRMRGKSPVRIIVGAPTDPKAAEDLRQALDRAALPCPCELLDIDEDVVTSPFADATVKKLAGAMRGWFPDLFRAPHLRSVTPPLFRYQMVEMARKANKRIVLPEGDEPRTLKAAAICAEKGIAHCVLLGKPDEIRTAAAQNGVTLPHSVEILDPDQLRPQYVAPMVDLRKAKGLTAEQANEALGDTVMLGTMMLAQGDVDGLVSGAVHTTANTVRPALQLIKTRPDASLVSSVFFMLLPEQVVIYGDCAINPDPSAEQLAEIAIQSADTAETFGVDPRVAMISYSTGNSGQGADVDKVKEATARVREARPDLKIDGPMQYDAATVESVARSKAPDSDVAGRANVFVFPDLNTGNTTYKAVQRSADVVSVGPMLQGLRKPVNDLSRGALVDDIVYTIALTAIQATGTDAGAATLPVAAE